MKTYGEQLNEAASDWQNKGCVKDIPLFENARTRWAYTDFKAGAAWQKQREAKLIIEAIDSCDGDIDYLQFMLREILKSHEENGE